MLTEEENKAIEYFKTYNWYADINTQHKNVDILLNLIEKLKKENEDLRVQGSIVYLDYKILKDKIRELLEKLNLKLDKLEQEMDKEYDMYGKSVEFLNLDEQYDYLYEIKELLEEE